MYYIYISYTWACLKILLPRARCLKLSLASFRMKSRDSFNNDVAASISPGCCKMIWLGLWRPAVISSVAVVS